MEILEQNHFYHIYNRGNNKQDIFLEKQNYFYFLKLLKKYILPITRVYSYCLLKNHFHLLVEIKADVTNPSQSFSNFFNAYTKAFNKKYDRVGSLFQRPFKRIKIKDESYLKALIVYIHLNPESHAISDDFKVYPYSSYQAVLSSAETNIERYEIIKIFGGSTNFEFVHNQRKYINDEKLSEFTFE